MSIERIYVAKKIKYDTDGAKIDLPKTLAIPIPNEMDDEDEIMDFISDEISNITGYCHFGFEAEEKTD